MKEYLYLTYIISIVFTLFCILLNIQLWKVSEKHVTKDVTMLFISPLVIFIPIANTIFGIIYFIFLLVNTINVIYSVINYKIFQGLE